MVFAIEIYQKRDFRSALVLIPQTRPLLVPSDLEMTRCLDGWLRTFLFTLVS